MWDRRVVEKLEEAVGQFSISCRFKNVSDHFEWAFTGIYGPNLNRECQFMWEELAGLISLWNFPWCLGGDFNIIHFPSERLGAGRFSRCMYDFSDFISLSMGLWIFLWRVVFSLGLTPPLPLELIGFSYPRSWQITSLYSPKKGFLEYYPITSLFFWRVGVTEEGEFLFPLRICG